LSSHHTLSRRRTLALGVSAGLVLDVCSSYAADVPPLKASVALKGKTYDYAMRDGQDQGDFRSEIGGFVQRCVRVVRSDCPLTVYFRPDRDSERVEFVFELGRIWNSQPAHLEAYSVTITRGSEQLAAIEVPKHYWFSRWRWQSEPRPIVGKIADLIALKLLPPYQIGGYVPSAASVPPAATAAAPAPPADHPKSLPGSGQLKLPGGGTFTAKGMALGLGQPVSVKGSDSADPTYSIMGSAGITPHMGQTGERAEIGIVTEYQARYIVSGAADALAVARAQAEAAGTLPWHIRDERTGAPVDLDAFPTMSWYPTPRANPFIGMPPTVVEIESAHQPALAYLPYLLTGDPYHLEDLQFAANYNRGCLPPDYRFSIPQVRGYAWNTRTRAQCAKVTPVVTPRWLLPRDYWEKDLERHRIWLTETYLKSSDTLCTVFRSVESMSNSPNTGPDAPGGCYIAPWQEDFLASVLGWVVLMGFESWRPIFMWKIGNTLARTNGKSGWPRSRCSPYRLILRPAAGAPTFKTWAEAWAETSRLWRWTDDDPDTIATTDDYTYHTYTRGALVFAEHLGVAEAGPILAWLNNQLVRPAVRFAAKWQLA